MSRRFQYVVTDLGRAALRDTAPYARCRVEITPAGKAALREPPPPPKPTKPERSVSNGQTLLDESGILRGETRAISEIFTRYGPLLRGIAWRLGVRDEHVVLTLLDDMIMQFLRTQQLPDSMPLYLVAALRNRIRRIHRRDTQKSRVAESAGLVLDGESFVPTSHSEFGLAASRPEREALPVSPAVERFAQAIGNSLTESERQLFVCEGVIAEHSEQLGITYGAARVKMFRARERLRESLPEHLSELAPSNRQDVEKLLQRGGIQL